MAFELLIWVWLAELLVTLVSMERSNAKQSTIGDLHDKLGLDDKQVGKGQQGDDAFLSEWNMGNLWDAITDHSQVGKLREQDSIFGLMHIIL